MVRGLAQACQRLVCFSLVAVYALGHWHGQGKRTQALDTDGPELKSNLCQVLAEGPV